MNSFVATFGLLLNLFAVSSICQAQSSWHCNTIDNNTPSLLSEKTQSKSTGLTSISCDKKIRVYFHVIRRSNSTGGLTSSQVTQLLTNLNSDYSALGIFFIEKGRSYINNDNYFNGSYDDTKFSQLVSTNRQTDAINIYLIQPDFARADKIPSNALAIGGSFALTSVISHEIGHCLGLYHTHRGTVTESGSGPIQCPELVDGTNGATCGDYITDTPADPNKWIGCTYSGTNVDANGQVYNPLDNNIMSYVYPTCLNQLTLGQKSRIHNTIEQSNSLLATLVVTEIFGNNQFCTTETYTVLNLSQNQNVTWSVSPTNLVSSTVNGNSITLNKIANGYLTLTATISGNCTPIGITKGVLINGPESSLIGRAWDSYEPNNSYHFYLTYNGVELPTPGSSSYFEFESLDGTSIYSGWGSNSNTQGSGTEVTIYNFNHDVPLRVRYYNECGFSDWNYMTIPYNTNYMYMTYPNPASNTLTVAKSIVSPDLDKSTVSATNPTVGFEIYLYNNEQKAIYQQHSQNGADISFSTKNIPDGTYYLHIKEGKNIVRKQIIIKH